jgi:hypothetical protein
MTDLTTKPCPCGQTMRQIIAYDDEYVRPYRKGWWCAGCNAWTDAKLRERVIAPAPENPDNCSKAG